MNKRQKKKAAKKAATYEGTQYRGGRSSGRKNLKKSAAGELTNQYGVTFTPEEKKQLENAVNRANYRRKKMLKQAATLPRLVGGRDTGDTVGSLQLMGKESDFILAKKTKSLQRFRSRAQFEKYMKRLDRVNSPEYLNERIRGYKKNYQTALENVFGDEAKDVIKKIRYMRLNKYMKMVEQDELLEISYIYDPSARAGKLNEIRRSLGMKETDEWGDEYIE